MARMPFALGRLAQRYRDRLKEALETSQVNDDHAEIIMSCRRTVFCAILNAC